MGIKKTPRGCMPLRRDISSVKGKETIKAAVSAFKRDLPGLLRTHNSQWVIYHGSKRIGFGKSKTRLLQDCYEQGYRDEELFVAKVQPEMPPSM